MTIVIAAAAVVLYAAVTIGIIALIHGGEKHHKEDTK